MPSDTPPPTKPLTEQQLLGRAISAVRKAAGLTQDGAADALGVATPTWQRYEWGMRDLSYDKLGRIAAALGASREDILRERAHIMGDSPPPPVAMGLEDRRSLTFSPPPTNHTTGIVVPLPGMVPLYGFVGAASSSRLTSAEQNLRGYVPMHPAQAHVREAFALEVQDVSMSPRYEPGEIVYLAPNRWPARGQDCVVVTQEGEGLIKRFLRRDAEFVHLQQLNPDQELAVAVEEVAAIHTVVGRG